MADWNDLKIHPGNWNKLFELVASGQLAFSVAAQKLLPVMLSDQQADPLLIANKLDLIQDAGEDEVNDWVQQVLSLMPDKVEEYRKGKKGSKGKADPKITTAKLNEILNQKP
jgi:aspartyl-tRNA(Asn)/glutamyl-tRNA(Gln) amidotransferase subunit B